MVCRIINKNIDIYSYPNEFEDNLGSITLGDLHGNTIKLLHFLFRHQIITFKKEVLNVNDAYQKFVENYELYGQLVQIYIKLHRGLHPIQDELKVIQWRIIKHLNNSPPHTAIDETKKNQELTQLHQQMSVLAPQAKHYEEQLALLKGRFRSCIEGFNELMTMLDVNDNKTLSRLIGDEVGDRGNCDYFTLKIFDFLQKNNSQLVDIISNHGCELIYAYEQFMDNLPFNALGTVPSNQAVSFLGLKLLIEEEIIDNTELCRLIENSYKPNLKLIDYSLSEQGITLFTHAPVEFDSIRLVAEHLGIVYADSTKEALAGSIDKINLKIQEYANKNILHTLFENDLIIDKTNMSTDEKTYWPLIYFTWNRWKETKETDFARPAFKNGYSITYVHGHDSFQSKLLHVHNLDTLCGKESRAIKDKRIRQAQFIKRNPHTVTDRKKNEDYLENVSRYKVFDSDEQSLERWQENKKASTLPYDSIKKLSLLGGSAKASVIQENKPLHVEKKKPAYSFEQQLSELSDIEFNNSRSLK
ncbi:Dot/Icm T4SS effector Wip [uncultured Legionella sp.]|uniref:Dot/Icm T4SS effector Wip n=1 Tax=uncultured Legionella sp. TaxID=210934 RepID=UPI00261C7614|nr:Dot/Icm T4SS effector Wip [uncultured Legionella sp.]